jgi:hypothetical protein
MADMILTRRLLDTKYASWFRNKQNTEQAKREILRLFSEEPNEFHEWSKQDIYEQSRKIVAHWDKF